MITRYIYTQFADLKEQGNYNLYGIIIDASFPILDPTTSKYTCVLKLIDQTTNYITNPDNIEEKVIYLIIKSDKSENMPYIKHIGDIIRIHYGLYSPKNKRYVYLNLCQDNKNKTIGDFCLYDITNKNIEPYCCSKDKYSEEPEDKDKINDIMNWTKNYFKNEQALKYEYKIDLDQRNKEGSDKDLIVHVTKKVNLNDQVIFFIQDESDGCELHTYKFFDYVKENDIIRIRKFKIFDNNNLVLNEGGNILIIPKESFCYKQLINALNKKLKQIKD